MHLAQHLFLSWMLGSRALPDRRDRVIVALAGIAPDLDAPILLAMGRDAFVEWHHDFTHHLVGAAVAAGTAALLARRRGAAASLAAAAWCLHLLCDMLGAGDRHPGEPFAYPLPLLWPFDGRAYDPFPFSWPLASWQNGVIMALLAALVVREGVVRGRTVVEIVSARADGAVVAAIRRRFRAKSGADRGASA